MQKHEKTNNENKIILKKTNNENEKLKKIQTIRKNIKRK